MGRPTKLTDDVATRICEAVAQGASQREAASAGLVHRHSVIAWAQRGAAERQRLETPGMAPLDTEAPYLDFLDRLEKAADEWVRAGLEAVRAAGEGEEYEETVVVEKVGGWDGKSRHADGAPVLHPVEQIVTVKKGRKKSWQAWAWLLERRRPDEFAQVRRTEITGLAGAPVQVESIEAKQERARTLVQDELKRKRAEHGITAPIDVASTVQPAALEAAAEDDDEPVSLADAIARGLL